MPFLDVSKVLGGITTGLPNFCMLSFIIEESQNKNLRIAIPHPLMVGHKWGKFIIFKFIIFFEKKNPKCRESKE
jgi:hypothetical protein